jgi:peroxiredoxin
MGTIYSAHAMPSRPGTRFLDLLAAMLVFGVVQFAVSNDASAHDPSLHGFAMVTFERPFPAPDFAVSDLGGERRTLASYRGQYVLLNFWATWCPPCLAEMPSMEQLQQKLSERRFTVVAASSDEAGASAVRPFIDKLGVTFPILLDTDKKMARVYGAQDLPLSFLINPQGQVIAAAKGTRDWASAQAIEVVGELISQ